MLGSFFCKNPCDVKKECASGVVKSSSLSSNAESLARESSDKQVEVGETVSIDCCSVSVVFVSIELPFVDFNCVFVDFGVTNTMRFLFPAGVCRQQASWSVLGSRPLLG